MTTYPMKLTCTKCGATDEGTLHIEDEPARDWVGLTDEQILQAWDAAFQTCKTMNESTLMLKERMVLVARAIEAKLREKNA